MSARSNAPLAGALTGIFLGQPSIGFLVGAGVGLTIAIVIWLLDSRRRRR